MSNTLGPPPPPVWAKLFSETNLAAQRNFSAKKGIGHLLQPPTAAVLGTLQIKMENRTERHKSISNLPLHQTLMIDLLDIIEHFKPYKWGPCTYPGFAGLLTPQSCKI